MRNSHLSQARVLNKNFQKEYLKILCCRYCRSQTAVKPLRLGKGVSTVVTSNVGTLGTETKIETTI